MATRRRKEFKFWLDLKKPNEIFLLSDIEDLKQKRKFTETCRNGIRIVSDLMNGNTDVLLELFPWVTDRIVAQYMAQNFNSQPPQQHIQIAKPEIKDEPIKLKETKKNVNANLNFVNAMNF